jgi:hypothetical protein
VLAPDEERHTSSGKPGTWLRLAPDVIKAGLTPLEERLLRRLAESRGQRVSMKELARDLGLPAAPSLEQDFPQLTAFCAGSPAERPFPVVSGGSGDAAWYWMSVVDAAAFAFAFEPGTPKPRGATSS